MARSQAREILSGCGANDEVVVDGKGLTMLSPSFADEMARVWPLHHPDTELKFVNFEGQPAMMLERAIETAKRFGHPIPERAPEK